MTYEATLGRLSLRPWGVCVEEPDKKNTYRRRDDQLWKAVSVISAILSRGQAIVLFAPAFFKKIFIDTAMQIFFASTGTKITRLTPHSTAEMTQEDLFEDFLDFFFPGAARDFDLERGFEQLDKEFDELCPPEDSTAGARYVDKLVKVFLKDGRENYFLIHIGGDQGLLTVKRNLVREMISRNLVW